jgi:hypothetical protein
MKRLEGHKGVVRLVREFHDAGRGDGKFRRVQKSGERWGNGNVFGISCDWRELATSCALREMEEEQARMRLEDGLAIEHHDMADITTAGITQWMWGIFRRH